MVSSNLYDDAKIHELKSYENTQLAKCLGTYTDILQIQINPITINNVNYISDKRCI